MKRERIEKIFKKITGKNISLKVRLRNDKGCYYFKSWNIDGDVLHGKGTSHFGDITYQIEEWIDINDISVIGIE